MLLSSSDTRETMMHLCLFTNTAQRELVLLCTQRIRNSNKLSLHPWKYYCLIDQIVIESHRLLRQVTELLNQISVDKSLDPDSCKIEILRILQKVVPLEHNCFNWSLLTGFLKIIQSVNTIPDKCIAVQMKEG